MTIDSWVMLPDMTAALAQEVLAARPDTQQVGASYWHCHAALGQVNAHATIDNMLAAMDAAGVDVALVSSALAVHAREGEQLREGNRHVLQACAVNRSRLIPALGISPRFAAESHALLDDLAEAADAVGPVWLPMDLEDAEDPCLAGMLERVGAVHLPVYAYAFYDRQMQGVLDLARRFPDIAFITPCGWGDRIDEITACPNLYVDTSDCSACLIIAFGRFVERLADRMVFSSGFPIWDMTVIKQAVERFVPAARQADVLGGTMGRLLGHFDSRRSV